MNAQVQALLTARGKVGVPLRDYEITDNADGQGPRLTRWDVVALGVQPTPAELAAVTPAQIAAAEAAQRTAQFALTSRQKDVLATMAMIVRARGIPAWNALTTPQKVAAALAEADVWVTIRDFVEGNF
ncbi:MAG TPA: hypothetical protein VK631_04670 [Solirubrobacteraceae bacterium]|nr:hypothetical protein [Solirubrobacteraceae bacterium]